MTTAFENPAIASALASIEAYMPPRDCRIDNVATTRGSDTVEVTIAGDALYRALEASRDFVVYASVHHPNVIVSRNVLFTRDGDLVRVELTARH